MTVVIDIPDTYIPERSYILSVLFTEFLGLDFEITVSHRLNTVISVRDSSPRLYVEDFLFKLKKDFWLTEQSLPKLPLKTWDLSRDSLCATTVFSKVPVIYGEPFEELSFLRLAENSVHLSLDIFGSSFFMLSRYEECVVTTRDQYDRFSAKESLAYKANFIDRPIVNEYLEILWSCLKRLWPNLQRKSFSYSLCLSHDVDNPFELKPFKPKKWLRRMLGDVYARHNLGLSSSLFVNGCLAALNLPYSDRLDTFDWLMDQSEKAGVKSAFYFICGHSASDPRYDVKSSYMRDLIRKILARGHEIGLHPSYDTYLNPVKLNQEFNNLKNILCEEGISDSIGGRQHYLRWRAPDTWQHWSDVGMSYDSTLGYADHVGFRCGTCYEYSVFNVHTRKALKLREKPLVAMECSLFASNYMAVKSQTDIYLLLKTLSDRCKLFSGKFAVLWHNDQLLSELHQKYYLSVLSEF